MYPRLRYRVYWTLVHSSTGVARKPVRACRRADEGVSASMTGSIGEMEETERDRLGGQKKCRRRSIWGWQQIPGTPAPVLPASCEDGSVARVNYPLGSRQDASHSAARSLPPDPCG